ncbi:hypothetical protein [Raoultella planticola]|uniref:hypothetical protein n=1 Tax=Raoultella planticola TaxID=575 RepID=UPI001185170D|nr:hypothetical protein [Raoultella planticola]
MTGKPLHNNSFVTFLFDADHPELSGGYNYATPCQDEFLKIITLVDQSKSLRAGVRHGDILLHNIASKLSRLTFHPIPSDPEVYTWFAGSHQKKN